MKLNYSTYIDIVREAGSKVKELCNKEGLKVEDKGGNDPLSEADLASNQILQKLQNEISGSHFFTEEASDDLARMDKEYVWIVDPIDGTREFIKGIPEFAVSVALHCRGRLLFSAVMNPFDSLAYQTEGSFYSEYYGEDEPEIFSNQICVSRSEWNSGIFEGVDIGYELKVVGSIAFKLSLVAQGRYQGVLSLRPKNEWDIAGGVGLVDASGQTASDVAGRKYHFNRDKRLEGVVGGPKMFVRRLLAEHNLYRLFKDHQKERGDNG